MQKFFSKNILINFSEHKQIKVLYDLANLIEQNNHSIESQHFQKLKNYHSYLETSEHHKIKILNKEFNKIHSLDYQFQIYLMNLERFLGQSKKDYEFIVKTIDDESSSKTFPIICVLDSIRSAHNVGSMFRNAECFGCHKIILTGLSPTPSHSSVVKVAMGTDQNIPWEFEKSLINVIKNLKNQGYEIWAIETGRDAIPIDSLTQIHDKIALIFGHEAHGIGLEGLKLSDKIVKIPLYGSKNSLNVAMSQGIILHRLVSLLT